MFNLGNTAVALVVGNATTEGLFNTSLKTFFMDGWGGKDTDGMKASNAISLPELLGMGARSSSLNRFGISQQSGSKYAGSDLQSLGKVIGENLKNNGIQMVITVVGAPALYKILKSNMRGLINPANKLLKPSGIKVA